jgi:hypothetical protein
VAEAVMFVDDLGRMTNFKAQRFNTSTRSIQPWHTPIFDYGDYRGFQLPRTGAAVWESPDGDLTYIEVEVTDVRHEY